MSVKGKSARGEIVDFDLLKIKEQMASAPPSIDVQARREFVEGRLRRRARKKVPQELLDNANNAIAVDQKLPSVEGDVAELIVEPEEIPIPAPTPAPATKQSARPKSTSKKKK